MISNQEAFTKIVLHLRKQRKKALNPNGSCVMRTADNLKCAAGCLIPDELFVQEMNEYGSERLLAFWPRLKEFFPEQNFISMMQDIHDYVNVVQWENFFRKTAEEYNLEIP